MPTKLVLKEGRRNINVNHSAFHIRDARSHSLLNTLPVLVLVASSNHAGEKEQERSEQSVPVYPV